MNLIKDREDLKVVTSYIAICILWGSTYLAMRIGAHNAPPMLFGGLRFTIAGAFMLLYSLIKKMEFPSNIGDVAKLSFTGTILFLGGNGLLLWAEQWVHSGIASVLLATTPLFIAIVELFVPNSTKISKKGWLGLIIGFIGAVFLVSSGKDIGAIDIKGSAIILSASLLWSVGSVCAKRMKPTGSVVPGIGIQLFASGVVQTIISLLIGDGARAHFTSDGIFALLYLIIFGSIIGYSCYIYVLKKWSAAKAGTYAYINPIVAVFLGALILDEPVPAGVIISTLIVLAGVILVQVSKTQPVSKVSKDLATNQ